MPEVVGSIAVTPTFSSSAISVSVAKAEASIALVVTIFNAVLAMASKAVGVSIILKLAGA